MSTDYSRLPLGVDPDEVPVSVHSASDDQDADNPFSVNYRPVANDGDDDKQTPMLAVDSFEPSGGYCDMCHACCAVDVRVDPPAVRRRKYCSTAFEAAAATTFCYWFERIIHNPFCNFIFKCGCTWNWDGGWDRCNVFNTVGAPKCPWCTAAQNVSWTTDSLLFALMVLTYFSLLANRKRVDAAARWAAPVLVYFAAGTLVGWLFKITGSYPVFVF